MVQHVVNRLVAIPAEGVQARVDHETRGSCTLIGQ